MSETRRCSHCLETKPLTDFGADKRGPGGLQSRCKSCVALKNKLAYERHAEKRKAEQRERNKRDRAAKSAYNKAYREQHREELVQYTRDWRAAGGKTNRSEGSLERQRAQKRIRYATDPAYRERAKAYAALFREKNPEKHAESLKQWRLDNLEKYREYHKNYARVFMSTPEGRAYQAASRLKHRAKRQARRAEYYAKRYGESGTITDAQLNWLHKWQDHCCCYCNAPLGGKETIEHVIPLNRGGENNPHNVLLACLPCNSSKQKRLFDETEWQPKAVYPAKRIHSFAATKTAFELCKKHNVEVEKDSSNELILRLANGKNLHVLSSFWLCDRADPPTTLETLHEDHPQDLLTFDYEWVTRPDAMINIVAAKAGQADSIGARKLEIASPTTAEARTFMSRWHIQGFAGGSWYVGLKHPGGDWCGMASFRHHKIGYEIARLTFKDHVVGGLSRIVSAFLAVVPEQKDILTYADTRFGEGAGYQHAGFEPDGESGLWYGYVNGVGIHSRQAYRKDEMAELLDWFDPEWTEYRLARANGLFRLTGLPQKRFVLKAK